VPANQLLLVVQQQLLIILSAVTRILSHRPKLRNTRFLHVSIASQGRKVPASIASKSREELEVLAVNLLKTLKQRDKKIAGDLY
jgi:hypothetical protein